MDDTPRTDNEIRETEVLSNRRGLCREDYSGGYIEYVKPEFARQLERELNTLRAENERLREIIDFKVIGWREYDWPEGFDRRTAELIADSVRQALNPQEPSDG